MYPTLEQVEQANHAELARWTRFLLGPGSSAIGQDNFHEVLKHEGEILDRILDRLGDLGGMNSTISKEIGWD